MKNIMLPLVLVILFQSIACNQNILSKFQQNGYKVKDKRTEVIRFNKNFFHTFELKTFKYNRTTPAMNGTFNAKVHLDDQVEIVVQVYKLLSNEYRYFPIRFQVNLQKIFASNAFGFKNMKMCGNLTSFILRKDVIQHFCSFVPDDNYLPPLIPTGLYKVENLMLYLNQDIGLFNLYGEVYTPPTYPNK